MYIHIISIYNIYNITELICQIHSNHEPWSWQSWCFHHFSQALVLQDLDSVVDGRHRGSRDRWDLAGPEVRRHRVPWRSGGSGAQGREERIDLPWKRRNLGRFWDVESLWKSVEFLDICDEATKLIKSDCSFTHAARFERNLPFSNQGVWYTCMSFKAPKTFAERCDFKNG